MSMIGDRLGLWQALADMRPVTSAELAERTGTVERYFREWLSSTAAHGYLTYDSGTGRSTLPAEHVPCSVPRVRPSSATSAAVEAGR